MKTLNTLLIFSLFIGLSSCKKDDPLVSDNYTAIQKIKDTEILLRNNLWGYHDMVVEVKYDMRAIPLLANVADINGMVKPGKYNSYAIYGNDNRQKNYSYQFGVAKLFGDLVGNKDYYQLGFYNVLNATHLKLNPDSLGSSIYKYSYSSENDLFVMISDQITNGKINDLVNQRVANSIISNKPTDISKAMVDKILNNPNVQESIQLLLYDMIHGKVEALTQNPDQISQKIAHLIIEELKNVDWENLVYDQIVDILNELKVNDPQLAAQTISSQISTKIETSLNEADIYNSILPILQNFQNETLPDLVPALSQAIYSVLTNVFTEDSIYDKIYPIWVDFSVIDSNEIAAVADTMGTVLVDHFFDLQNLTVELTPFITTLRNTSTFQIPNLAQSIIDNTLKPKIDSINAHFPGMDIDPNWSNVKTVLSSALTVIKSSITGLTDAEAAAILAQDIIALFDSIISQGINQAIRNLQVIPADQASQIIAAWVSNLVIVGQPQIVSFITDKLNSIADLFNAEASASLLAQKIEGRVLSIFSEVNIYNLILPVMENLNELDINAVAEKMADWLTDLEIIQDNVTEEQLQSALTDIVSDLVGQINVDNATQKLMDAIMQSNIVSNIDGTVLKQVMEMKIYEFIIEIEQQINAIDRIEFSLERK